MSDFSGKSDPVDLIIDKSRKLKIEENRKKLKPIVETVVFLGRNGLAFRGHREGSSRHPEFGTFGEESCGLFIESINFRVMSGDNTLKEHLDTCPKNATLLSKTIQNDLIKCCGQSILNKILADIKKAVFFSIIGDEASDSSTKEQLSLVIRFFDSERIEVTEEFVGFIHCSEGLTGEALASVILKRLKELGLDIMDCRGQGYDGAGEKKGCASRITCINCKALYTHCFCHRLNLAVCGCFVIPIVRDMMSNIKEISKFFNNSENRLKVLEKNINEHCEQSVRKKLLDVCRTRWCARIDAMILFEELFPAIINALEELANGKSSDTSKAARAHFNSLHDFQFIVALVVVRVILERTKPATEILQARNADVLNSLDTIKALKRTAKTYSKNSRSYHDEWYEKAKRLAEKVDVEEAKRRTCKRQTLRDNPDYTDTSDYYYKVITFPFINHFYTEMKSRFDKAHMVSYQGLYIIPSKIISSHEKHFDWRTPFQAFVNFYEDDFPSIFNLQGELDIWENVWLNSEKSIPNSVISSLRELIPYGQGYPNILVALKILATLPITSCECERSFSSMRRLKSCFRSTMGGDRLNGLSLMYVHREIVPDTEEVIDLFARLGPRRLEFL